jgi:sulfonate transport system permease protein
MQDHAICSDTTKTLWAERERQALSESKGPSMASGVRKKNRKQGYFEVSGSLGRFGVAALLPGVVFLAWWLLGRFEMLNPYLTPTIGEVLGAAEEAFLSGELWAHASVSLARVFGGFAITVVMAVPLATLLSFFPSAERLLVVPLEFIRTTPPLAAVPLLILWLGIGEGSKLAIIILASFFPVFLNVLEGLKRTDSKLLEMGETIDLTPWDAFRSIMLPSALPSVITGLRLGFGYSWRALIGAELIAASSGLGYMILDAEELARTDRIFVGILLIGGLGSLFDALFSRGAETLSRALRLTRREG